MYKFRPLPKKITDAWDRQIEVWNDRLRNKYPQSYDKLYLQGYEARDKGLTLKQEVLNYLNGR